MKNPDKYTRINKLTSAVRAYEEKTAGQFETREESLKAMINMLIDRVCEKEDIYDELMNILK